ncbi:MAG: divergent polysaccharide deacetylase family protein [Alphaproteobacteria bacterium]|nr:divergent polysaccharide deacetylase family protein [Alphaproteobacteria bacterium]
MSTVGRWSPFNKPIIWGVALCLPLMGMIAALWTSSFGEPRRSAEASLSLTLPPRPPIPGETLRAAFTPEPNGTAVEGSLANPAFTAPALDPRKPNKPDLQLVDASPFGPLPRIGEDGRRPVQAYARAYDRSDDRPKVAIMVTGLGQQADATNASFHLPGAISLTFSPYTEDLPAYFERARLAGHEVLLELPMEPTDYPASDPGPHTLRASGTVDANIERLNWVLARAPGYFAVAGQGGAFADSPEATPVMDALAAKGVGMIEIDGDGLARVGEAAGLAYMSAPDWIDATPSAQAIDQALGDLEAKARQQGSAVGIAEAYPITLKRLADWAATLEARGLALVPASAVLLDTAGLIANDNEGSNLAQSRN